MRGHHGLTLVEVLVALAVLATGIVALQGLLTRSVGTIAADVEITRATLLARTLLTEATLTLPPRGVAAGTLEERGRAGRGLAFTREVRATAHPGLREVRIRVHPKDSPSSRVGCELVELVRVPTT